MPTPSVTLTPSGYLAVSPPGFRFRIGVVADDPAEAERRWQVSLVGWERLYAEAQTAERERVD